MDADGIIGTLIRELERVKAQDWTVPEKGRLLAAVKLQLTQNVRDDLAAHGAGPGMARTIRVTMRGEERRHEQA
jgi:hypothetical protein